MDRSSGVEICLSTADCQRELPSTLPKFTLNCYYHKYTCVIMHLSSQPFMYSPVCLSQTLIRILIIYPLGSLLMSLMCSVCHSSQAFIVMGFSNGFFLTVFALQYDNVCNIDKIGP